MRNSLAVHAVLIAVAGALMAGCHHPAQTAVTPQTSPRAEYCWWAAYRTAMPPDSVAARYAGAYTTLGLANSGWSHLSDTAWAEAGPTTLAREAGTAIYRARVVAIRRGDTTFFRPFIAVQEVGSANLGALGIGFCGEASREAKTGGTAPRDQEPDDSLPLWRRRATR